MSIWVAIDFTMMTGNQNNSSDNSQQGDMSPWWNPKKLIPCFDTIIFFIIIPHFDSVETGFVLDGLTQTTCETWREGMRCNDQTRNSVCVRYVAEGCLQTQSSQLLLEPVRVGNRRTIRRQKLKEYHMKHCWKSDWPGKKKLCQDRWTDEQKDKIIPMSRP